MASSTGFTSQLEAIFFQGANYLVAGVQGQAVHVATAGKAVFSEDRHGGSHTAL